jgi:Na+-transporting NADH:ubiquinone oxidoreductase subunit C
MEVAARDPTVSQVVPAAVDIAGIKRRPRYAPVYLVPGEDGIETIVLPVKGYGLWSTMYGFLALEGDGNTVKGLTFYQHGETPGLGGEIENPRWQARFSDKKVYGAEGEVRLHVAKGATPPDAPNAEYVVDGISGATLTMNGVSHMIEYWLGERGFGPYLQRLRQGGGST